MAVPVHIHTQGKCDFVCPLLSLLDGAGHGSTSCKSGNYTCPVLSSSSLLLLPLCCCLCFFLSCLRRTRTISRPNAFLIRPPVGGRPTVFPSHCNPPHSTPLRWPASAASRPPSATCRLGPVNPPPVASNCILNLPYFTLTTYSTQVHRSRTVQHFHLQYN